MHESISLRSHGSSCSVSLSVCDTKESPDQVGVKHQQSDFIQNPISNLNWLTVVFINCTSTSVLKVLSNMSREVRSCRKPGADMGLLCFSSSTA